MKNLVKFAGALVLMASLTAFADDKQMANAKAMMMKDRQAMMGQVNTIDQNAAALAKSMKSPSADQEKQIAALQAAVAELKKNLASAPHYFDPPQGGGNPSQ